MNLIIVESPTKANTFNKFLKGKDFHVEATMGHVRDLPEKKLGIDLEHDFKPDYEISSKKKDVVKKIKQYAKDADTIILATDADREGEAISYHIAYLLGKVDEKWPEIKLKKSANIKRIVFHEITEEALKEALENPGELNISLVDSQQSRRILDRLVGYKLSPLLWKKMGKRWLSAGRVQTVALRFIVEREKEIKAFTTEPYFKAIGNFAGKPDVEARLISKNGEKYEKSFSLTLFDGKYTYTKTTIAQDQIEPLKADINSDTFKVSEVSETQSKRYPTPPLTTSQMQQEASRTYGYSSKTTMRLAQNLYEKGLITYHRTDSTNLSAKFISQAQSYIKTTYGSDYTLEAPRIFKTKSKMAQEAHEAIRPTKLNPSIEDTDLTNSHKKLYELIFRKAVASQMKEAMIKTIKIKILGNKGYLFESSFEQIMFLGFLKLYPQKEQGDHFVPKQGDAIHLNTLLFTSHDTQPPPRYNEASLIKTLEEKGIGRPSTYAPIVSTIQDRQYVEKKENRFYPTMLGTAVCDYLSKAFPELFGINFTAGLEDSLDEIADGKKKLLSVLTDFYKPFAQILSKEEKNKEYIDVQETTDEKCPECGKPLVMRYSKYGKFYACSGYPDCKYKKNFVETLAQKCPQCGGNIVVKYTKTKKKFYGCSNYPKCTFAAWYLSQINKAQEPAKTEKIVSGQ
jgi:DNA topoisomerase-1